MSKIALDKWIWVVNILATCVFLSSKNDNFKIYKNEYNFLAVLAFTSSYCSDFHYCYLVSVISNQQIEWGRSIIFKSDKKQNSEMHGNSVLLHYTVLQ